MHQIQTNMQRSKVRVCVLSPDLFDVYNEIILRSIYGYHGVKVNSQNINNLRYVDDTVLIADSEKQLKRIVDAVIEDSEKKGLELNVNKTECMVVTKKANTHM